MPNNQPEPTSCQALTPVFALLGKRWTGLIIVTLLHGPTRFAELRRAIPGVSERMVSGRLNELISAGLVERRVLDGPPVGVEYRLTPCGEALRPALTELGRWAAGHLTPTSPGRGA
ncbi:MAG TPA: helix-turn-helix domain-containing protein [Acidimicrobiales bacterium]|nr:helix-turn-helix domain-containing protein [Acidimicrobiales bacterium]